MVLNVAGIVDSVLFHTNSNTSGVDNVLPPVEAADSEVHWFRNRAALFGYSSLLGATGVPGDGFSILMNTWKRSRTIELPWFVTLGSSGKPTRWQDVLLGLKPDADWSVTGLQTSGADDKDMAVLLHILYGDVPKPPAIPTGEQTIEFFQAPAAVTADDWSEVGVINDLDPDSIYALLGMTAISANAIAVRAKADSFQGATPAWLGASVPQVGVERLIDQAKFAMYFTGRESLTIEAFCGAAEQPYIYALLANCGESPEVPGVVAGGYAGPQEIGGGIQGGMLDQIQNVISPLI